MATRAPRSNSPGVVEKKNITIALTQPFGSTTLGAATVYSAVYRIPDDVTTVYMQLGYCDQYTPAGNAADITSQTVAGGQPSADRQSFVGTPTTAVVTCPAFNLSSRVAMPVQCDANRYMMFRWQQNAGTVYIESTAGAVQSGLCKSKTGTNVLDSSGWADTDSPAGQVAISFATDAVKLVGWSDSIPRGIAQSGVGGLLGGMARLGPNRGYAVSMAGVASSTAQVWGQMSNWMLGIVTPVRDAHVWVSLGHNDIANGTGAVALIGYLKLIYHLAYAEGAKSVIATTIAQSSAITAGAKETARTQTNTWLRALPGCFDTLLDVDTIIGASGRDPGGIHFTTAAWDLIEPQFPVLT